MAVINVAAFPFLRPYRAVGEPDIDNHGRIAVWVQEWSTDHKVYLLIDPDTGTVRELLRTGRQVSHPTLGLGTFSPPHRRPAGERRRPDRGRGQCGLSRPGDVLAPAVIRASADAGVVPEVIAQATWDYSAA